MMRSIGVTKRILEILQKLAKPRLWRSERDLKKLYQTTFSGTAGEACLLDLAEKFHLGLPIKADEFKNGERNVVLYIVKQIYEPIEQEKKQEEGGA